jgi:hypothetical protein
MREKMEENLENKKIFSNPVLVMFAVILLSCLCCSTWFYNLDLASSNAGQRNAQPIIQALETYKNDVGIYPTSLNLLQPKYINKIPKPDWRQEYQYYLYSSDDINYDIYKLEFRLGKSADDWDCYDSYSKSWQVGDDFCEYDLPYTLSP